MPNLDVFYSMLAPIATLHSSTVEPDQFWTALQYSQLHVRSCAAHILTEAVDMAELHGQRLETTSFRREIANRYLAFLLGALLGAALAVRLHE